MRLSRRRMLAAGAAAVAAAAAGGVGLRTYRRRQRAHVYSVADLAAHLLDTFDYLRPTAIDAERFAVEYLRHHNATPESGALPHAEQTFLLSTDFFPKGQPPDGPIAFVRLYHPYVHPCYNPLTIQTLS